MSTSSSSTGKNEDATLVVGTDANQVVPIDANQVVLTDANQVVELAHRQGGTQTQEQFSVATGDTTLEGGKKEERWRLGLPRRLEKRL